nr:MAG TPA: hypothetical protein [Caudoviricetes sp.]
MRLGRIWGIMVKRSLSLLMYFLMFMFVFHGYLANNLFQKIFASSGSIPEIPISHFIYNLSK